MCRHKGLLGLPDVGREGFVGAWVRRVLGGIEDVDVDARRLGGDDEGVLRHVTRAVHLSLVQDALVDLNLGRHGVVPVAAALCGKEQRGG